MEISEKLDEPELKKAKIDESQPCPENSVELCQESKFGEEKNANVNVEISRTVNDSEIDPLLQNKIESTGDEKIDAKNVALIIERILSSKNNLTPVSDNKLEEVIPTTKAYAAIIKDKKFTSKVVVHLNKNVPMPCLQHLKRIRNSTVILCLLSELGDNTIEDFIKRTCPECVDYFSGYVIVEVPIRSPKIRRQFEECNKVWPCNFHPDKHNEKLVSGNFFNQEDLITHKTLMAMCFEIGLISNRLSGTVVYNPNSRSIIAVGYDNRKVHPMQHAVMTAIDNVARSQGGGSWDCPTYLFKSSSVAAMPDIVDFLHSKYPTFKFENGFTKKDEDGEVAYLCTGYFVYTINEPCIMCSMALVHARASRVFYSITNEDGGLKSKCSLHLVRSLNHHYEVFSGFL